MRSPFARMVSVLVLLLLVTGLVWRARLFGEPPTAPVSAPASPPSRPRSPLPAPSLTTGQVRSEEIDTASAPEPAPPAGRSPGDYPCLASEKQSESIDRLLGLVDVASPELQKEMFGHLLVLADLPTDMRCGWAPDTLAEVDAALCRVLARIPEDPELSDLLSRSGRSCR